MKTLFKTVVGSHVWNMQRPDSDIDTFEAFIVPTKKILSGDIYQDGKNILYSSFTKDGLKDKNRHEIGSVIEELLNGNFNYIVGVCSPIAEDNRYGYLAELRDITKRNLAKNIYHSTMGLAVHNYKKYFVNNVKDGTITKEELQKKTNLIVRSLMFGYWILFRGEIYFTPIRDKCERDINIWMTNLEEKYKESTLPERPDPTEFRDLLYKIRIAELSGEL